MSKEILNDLIKINTINDIGNEEIRKYLKKFLKPLQFSFEEIGEGSKKVLVAKRGKGNLAFVCHTDTVSDSPLWDYNPFLLTKENDKLYGLGVSDMKGGIAALLQALKELDVSYPCICYFTYDEEINFTGIQNLKNKKNDFPKNLIFTEPTDLVPIIANKGCLEFKVTFNGKSAHSSTPMLGENAILKSLQFINDLKSYAKSLEEELDDIYEIPYTTFNLAKIIGGEAINKVPDNCQIYFDFRTINYKQEKRIIKKLEELSKKYEAELEIINNVSAAKCISENFIKKVELICKNKKSALNYVTEASFFKNKNMLILGPGPVTAHQSNEYILESSYLKTIDIYKKIIMELSNFNDK